MLEPNTATLVLIGFSILLLVVIPILDGSERFNKYISLRYILTAVSLIMSIGCILDFSHLSETSRNIVLFGGLILVGLFVVVRSLEKFRLGNKTIHISGGFGNAKGEINIQNKNPQENDDKKHLMNE